jgi:hypothetical protein
VVDSFFKRQDSENAVFEKTQPWVVARCLGLSHASNVSVTGIYQDSVLEMPEFSLIILLRDVSDNKRFSQRM